MSHKINAGGLFRCCVDAVAQIPDDRDEEGSEATCPHCRARLVFRGGAWRWAPDG